MVGDGYLEKSEDNWECLNQDSAFFDDVNHSTESISQK